MSSGRFPVPPDEIFGCTHSTVLMNNLRENLPTSIDSIPVAKVHDFRAQQTFVCENDKFQSGPNIPIPQSNVLQFVLVDGTKVSVRPSGTEPKIKFYISVRDGSAQGCADQDLPAIKEACVKRVARLESWFVERVQGNGDPG